jgi:transketolase
MSERRTAGTGDSTEQPRSAPRDPAELARAVRAHCLRMVHRARASHIGGCLSSADLLASLYGGFLRVAPGAEEHAHRDRFLLSKGHAAAALYATLAERGFLETDELDRYCEDGGRLGGHVTHTNVPGVEVSTGSLGHGLPLAVGMALGLKRDYSPARVAVLLSDGECDEGSTWEGFLIAPQLKLDNLLVLVDYNKIQSLGRVEEVLDLHPLAEKLRAFRWAVREIDGHDHEAIADALGAFPFEEGRPSVIVAHTVKGKGVSFMEDRLLWHYRSPDDEQLRAALSEIGAGAGEEA